MAPRKARNVPSRVGEEEEDASDDAIVVVVNVVILAKDDDCKSGRNVASSFCLGFRLNPKLFPPQLKFSKIEVAKQHFQSDENGTGRKREREKRQRARFIFVRSLFFLSSRDGELCSDNDNEATETTAPVF